MLYRILKVSYLKRKSKNWLDFNFKIFQFSGFSLTCHIYISFKISLSATKTYWKTKSS
jgi:hypothetical protein